MVLKNKIAEEGKVNINPVHLNYEFQKNKNNTFHSQSQTLDGVEQLLLCLPWSFGWHIIKWGL